MKKYFLTGLVLLLPVALTIMIMWFLFDFFTNPFLSLVTEWFAPILKKVNLTFSEGTALFISRVFALIILYLFIFLLGVIARWFLIKNLLSMTHRILSKIPLIKSIYKICREVSTALFSSDEKKFFKNPVLIPFPHSPSYCIGFRVGEVAQEIQKKINTPLISVFSPTAPHPISGFLFIVPEQNVHKIEMTNEDAIKYLVSCGLVKPEATLRKVNHESL